MLLRQKTGKSNFRKKGFILPHILRVEFIMLGSYGCRALERLLDKLHPQVRGTERNECRDSCHSLQLLQSRTLVQCHAVRKVSHFNLLSQDNPSLITNLETLTVMGRGLFFDDSIACQTDSQY